MPKFEPITVIVANRRPVRLKCPQSSLASSPEDIFLDVDFNFLITLLFCVLTVHLIPTDRKSICIGIGVLNPWSGIM